MRTDAMAGALSRSVRRPGGCRTAASLPIVVALSFVPFARGETDFPLARIRERVVSVVTAPACSKSSVFHLGVRLPSDGAPAAVLERRGLGAPWIPAAKMAIRGLPPPLPPHSFSRPAASLAPVGSPVFSGSRLTLAAPSAPVSSVSPRTEPFVAFFPPVSRPPVDERRVIVLLGGLPADRADQIAALLAYEAMQEGTENPTDPRWRPSLAHLVAHPPRDIDADAVYQLLLAGFEGVDDDARMRLAEAWAARHDGGRYAGDIAYASLRAVFNAGDYRGVYRRAEAVAAAHPGFAVRAKLLSVLADGYELENARAKATLATLKESYADSPEYPEILYMEAWLALETFREGEAKAILHRILRDHPSSPAARKATQILEAL